MNKIVELYGVSTVTKDAPDWNTIAARQHCPFLGRKCIKVRKSKPEQTIGTCTVAYGREPKPIIICPHRLLERRQVFVDCLHLLHLHQPGNQLHLVPEVTIPGGSVDYFLVSAIGKRVRDFVGIEFQTLDTTGTVWPDRQRLLKEAGAEYSTEPLTSGARFGMNWKMTAKTILVQLHHKVQTFERINKHIVLAVQDAFMEYVQREFSFGHIQEANSRDPMQIHTYRLNQDADTGAMLLQLSSRHSTDADGVATALGLQVDQKVEVEQLINMLELKISDATRFIPVG